MISLTGLHIHPIKSCGAINLNEATVEPLGLGLDRRWMLVDRQGEFLSQRAFPLMATIRLNLASQSELIVRAPGMAPLVLPTKVPVKAPKIVVTVWGTALEALDCGTEFHDWFSSYLGTEARLVCFDPEVMRQCSLRWTGERRVMTQFSDGFPLLVTSTASLDDLNARMQQKGAPAIPMNRFRPNLVLSGLPAYEEDYVDTLTLGEPGKEIVLRLVKPCARCPMPGIDQHSGLRDAQWPHEPLDTLTTYRADARVDGVTFGQNAIVIAGFGNILRLGMAVQAVLNF
jgi:uncharacterized protein